MMKQHNKLGPMLALAVAGCGLLVACATAAMATPPIVSMSHNGATVCGSLDAPVAYDHMVSVARSLESSGKLADYILDNYPKSKLLADHMAAASSDQDPVKRSPDEEESKPSESNVTTTTPSALDTIKAMVIASSQGPSTTIAPSSTVAPVAVVKSEPAAVVAAAPANKNSTTPAPKVSETTSASNVTVNVFLQLAPDAKTDELINNPDKAIATPAPSPSVTESPASAVSTAASSSPVPAAASSTEPSATANSTAAASPATVVASPAPQKTEAAAAATSVLKGFNRRRRWTNEHRHPTVASASAPKQATSSTTSTTTTTTTTAAPSSTTTTTTPAPSTSTTTTTTTTTTTPAPPTSTTVKATSAPATTTTSTTTTTKLPKSTSTTVATVEVSAKDLVAAASNQAAAKETSKPVEIVVSSVASPPAPTPSATTSTTTTTTTTPKPTEPSTTTTSTTTTPAPKPSTSAAAGPATPVAVSVVNPVAPSTGSKPVEQGPVAGMQQLISSCEEATSHLTIANNSEDQKTTIIKLHHSNEVKRETEEAHSNQQHHERRDQDKLNELALDNSNVIYDNDNEHINLNYPAPVDGNSDLAQSDPMKTQMKHPNSDQFSSPTSSFVHREHTDETQEAQDNYATCLLVRAVGANADGNITELTGRLNFWQPIQNRGVAHMIARFRYNFQHVRNKSEEATGSVNTEPVATTGQLRLRRESFQALIERAPPAFKNQHQIEPATASATTKPDTLLAGGGHQLIVHQIWLHENGNDDCGAGIDLELRPRKLVAEVKAIVVNGTVDIDSEIIVGHLNLAESNSILNKCLKMNTILVQNNASDYSDRVSSQPKSSELQVGHCKIVPSDKLPLVSELDPTSSVTSNIQPIREDLLVSSSSPTSSSSSVINKTAPNNRKALFELM